MPGVQECPFADDEKSESTGDRVWRLRSRLPIRMPRAGSRLLRGRALTRWRAAGSFPTHPSQCVQVVGVFKL